MRALALSFTPSRATLAPAALPLLGAALATALFVALLGGDLSLLSTMLGDSDDAVRLVAVRELLAGAPWFDTTLPRIGAPEPLLSHWSRLIDLPLALSIGALSPVLGPERAELVTRIGWPVLLFFALLLVMAREAQRRAGTWGAAFAIALALTCATALVQFKPGRIDHHNAQVLCAVAGVLFLARSFAEPRAGWIAGVLLGLGLAVGYEAIVLVVPAIGIAALVALWRPREHAGVANALLALAAALAAAYAATVPPSRWLDVRCDALSLNLVVLAAFGAGGLWAAIRYAGCASFALRLAIAGAGAAAGAVAFGALEPACLAGPFGQVNPELKAIWLDEVLELKSVAWLAARHPAAALTFVAFAVAGAGAQIDLWRKDRDAGSAFLAVMVVLAVLLGCWQMRLMSYASWLAILPLAVLCARLDGTAAVSTPLVRVAAVLLLNQVTLGAAAEAAVSVTRSVAPSPAAVSAGEAGVGPACAASPAVRRLAALPPGLVAADLDLGPYIVANTAHRVVAAPYHRLDKGILANEHIFAGPAAGAETWLRSLGADYVVLCVPAGAGRPGSLREALLKGEVPTYLRAIELPGTSAIRAWRVVR